MRTNDLKIEGWVNSRVVSHYNNTMGYFHLYFGKKRNGTYLSVKVVFYEALYNFATSLNKGDYLMVYGRIDVNEYDQRKEVVVVANKIDLLRTNNG